MSRSFELLMKIINIDIFISNSIADNVQLYICNQRNSLETNFLCSLYVISVRLQQYKKHFSLAVKLLASCKYIIGNILSTFDKERIRSTSIMLQLWNRKLTKMAWVGFRPYNLYLYYYVWWLPPSSQNGIRLRQNK